MDLTTQQCEAVMEWAIDMRANQHSQYMSLRMGRLRAGGQRHDHAVLRDDTGKTLRAELLAELCDGPNFAKEVALAFLRLHGKDALAQAPHRRITEYEQACRRLAEAIINAYGIPDAARSVEPDQEEPT